MKLITNFLASVMVAGWIATIAVFSIQNITAVSLKFLTFESIKLPIGVLLSLCVGVGIIVGSILIPNNS